MSTLSWIIIAIPTLAVIWFGIVPWVPPLYRRYITWVKSHGPQA